MAGAVIAIYPNPTKWSNAQLKIIITPLKTKIDGAMLTLKGKMLEAYETWKDCSPPSFTIAPEVVLVVERPFFVERPVILEIE